MMWERCAELVTEFGGSVAMRTYIETVHRNEHGAVAVTVKDASGVATELDAGHVISSMPFLAGACDGPTGTRQRHRRRERLAVPGLSHCGTGGTERFSFPDNWIYIHSPNVKVGRIQNFGSWSPFLVKDGRTCLGLEYFVNEGDSMWSSPDDDLVELAKRELEELTW